MWIVDNLLNKAIATFTQMEMAGIKPTLRAVLTTHAQSSNHTLDAYICNMIFERCATVFQEGHTYKRKYVGKNG
ncbi:hypothetical protein HID58_047089 [Brassica napus]|uniref:Uncharacterized protein n=1 Tax=Brassica napus TaxID=3708 RepID=A0ABQ8AYB5_BRANA|nr:hypothetical protein HID58_047089 [Brassica napus]